jgi:hypothetical protein
LFLIGYCLEKSSLKLLGKMEPNLAGSIDARSSIKLRPLVPFGQQTWPPRLILFSDWLMLKKSSPLKQLLSPLSLYHSPDNRMILKQISKGDNHYLKKLQPS